MITNKRFQDTHVRKYFRNLNIFLATAQKLSKICEIERLLCNYAHSFISTFSFIMENRNNKSSLSTWSHHI